MPLSDRGCGYTHARGAWIGEAHAQRRDIPLHYSGAVVILVLLQFMVVTAEAKRCVARTPIAGLTGGWFGNGTVFLSGGSRERVRCRSAHPAGGSTVSGPVC